jgi:hypothetical protein
LHVAALLDRRGSLVVDARESYWRRATGGLFAPPDLELGERLLVDCGLVEERMQTLYPLPALEGILDGAFGDAVAAICARVAELSAARTSFAPEMLAHGLEDLIPDPKRREELLRALGRRFDDTHRRLLGAIGEEVVVKALRTELVSLGYPDIARDVSHLSLETDQAGYDISAPRIVGESRLIEVKATMSSETEVDIHLSRNEIETGLCYERDWSVVLCRITDVDRREADTVGWCPVNQLTPMLPNDVRGGRWETAVVTLVVGELIPGFPSAAA